MLCVQFLNTRFSLKKFILCKFYTIFCIDASGTPGICIFFSNSFCRLCCNPLDLLLVNIFRTLCLIFGKFGFPSFGGHPRNCQIHFWNTLYKMLIAIFEMYNVTLGSMSIVGNSEDIAYVVEQDIMYAYDF